MSFICAASNCGKETDSSLKCPVCLKHEVTSVFCNQNCFRSSWATHKSIHPNEDGSSDSYNPWPTFEYTGDLRPHYPLSQRRPIPKHIKLPDYAANGKPILEIKNDRLGKITILGEKDIGKIRKVGRLSREILDATAKHIAPGITTDKLDEILHKECLKRNAYPSPLNYYNFPKSICTSINEVICHGIPDQTELKDGDIINLDVTIYYLGFNADLNETYYVGDKSKSNPEIVNLVETTRESLDLAIASVKPGLPFREIGNIIESYASKKNCSVVRTYCGHGINQLFHCQPNIPHYAKNKAIGIAKPGMVFTIEPMLNLGLYRDLSWPDKWTSVTSDGKYSAQFEEMLLVTETGVERLTGRLPDSPGGPVERI